ncbi:glycoside hydrolase family 13 protein [uncultured Photobacterium sp.]|uniref:glycoside hydrolase family 13 protein n=1 Tax=uncultured Photobacterium sp. TaxID=173973 RepID=UPI002626CC1A|nr:glycoside hydrolase family 13 protein [uncultured Photobacterium sp.]
MITRSSLIHTAKSAFSYANDNETLHIRMRSAKGEVGKVTLWIGDPYKWEEGGLDGGNLEGSDAYGWSGGEEVDMELEGSTDLYDCWFAEYKPTRKRTRYGFILTSLDGSETLLFGEKKCVPLTDDQQENSKALSHLSNFYCFPYINPADVLKTPAWVKDTVWYQIFPERFANGRPEISPANAEPWGSTPTNDNFMGGDLWGVIDNLDYLQELGINGLYFCPIFFANANHKYDTIDYMQVDPHFGGKEAFKALVDAAHKRGMKVMLDAVFNHIGSESPLWLDVVENGDKSKYKDWFWIKDFPVYPDKPLETWDFTNLNYETFGNVHTMPKLNTENPECRAYLLDVARYWVEEFDIDGWRLDVANEVDHQFWRDFRKVVKSIKPDCYILGEIWHEGMAWLQGDQYDSLMNYPLTSAIKEFFAFGHTDAQSFQCDVNNSYLNYPRNVNASIFNLLESHDTSRIISEAAGSKEKATLAYLFMFTQVGSPCIYYGGEIGMEGYKAMGSEAHRKCMEWDESKQDQDFKAFIQSLINLRKEFSDLQAPSLQWLHIGEQQKTLIYQRGNMIILINNEPAESALKLPAELANKSVKNLLTYKDEEFENQMILPAYGYKVIKVEK